MFATPEDLEETARLVKEAGRRIVTAHVDVRDRKAVKARTVHPTGVDTPMLQGLGGMDGCS